VNSKIPFVAYIVFVAGILVTNCDNQELNYVLQEKDGTKFISNLYPYHSMDPTLKLDFVNMIKELPKDQDVDGNYLFYRIFDLVVDDLENIYIVDNGNSRIQKFDKSGKYLLTIGREGQGPGDLGLPRNIGFTENDQLYISEIGNSRVQLFNKNGDYVKTIRMNFYFDDAKILNTETIIVKKMERRIKDKYDPEVGSQNLLAKYDINSGDLEYFGKEHTFTTRVENYMMSANRVVNRSNFTFDEDENIYVNFTHWNKIQKYNNEGKLILDIDRKINFSIDHKVVDDKQTYTFVSEGVGIDFKDRIWVLSYGRAQKNNETFVEFYYDFSKFHFDVFDERGIWLEKVPFPDLSNLVEEESYILNFKIFKDKLFLLINGYTESVIEYQINSINKE